MAIGAGPAHRAPGAVLLALEIASFLATYFNPNDLTNDNTDRAARGFVSGALILTGAFTIIASWVDADQRRTAAS